MNLSFPISDNLAGLEAFYFVEVEHVYQDLGDDILLSDTNIWNIGKASKFTPKFRDRLRRNQRGSKISITLTGSIGKKSEALSQVLKKMKDRYYIVIYKDFNGQYVRAGSKDHPLKFSYSGNTGRKPGSFAGAEFEFSGTLLDLPQAYYGVLPTDGGVINEEVTIAVEPVTVKWNDDTVIAVLEPGQTLVLKSEFQVTEFEVI